MQHFSRRTFLSRALSGTTLLLLAGCGGGGSSPSPPTAAARGQLLSYNKQGRYDRLSMDIALQAVRLNGLTPTRFEVDVYAVTYNTLSFDGTTLVTASGLVAVPVGTTGARPLVAYFHGTTTQRLDVPSSTGSLEGQLAVAVFGAAGYVVAAPDYLGLGASPSNLRQTFEQADSLATTGIDLLRATRTLMGKIDVGLSSRLFLTGLSEGGYATMAIHRALERDYASEFTVTASAPVAGPYDLSGTTLTAAFSAPGPNTPAEVAGLLLGYHQIYPLFNSLSDVFAAPYDSRVISLFDGTHTLSDVQSALPATVTALLTPAFANAVQSNPDHPLRTALRANDVDDWKNVAPIRLYHGEADQDVLFQNAVVARDQIAARGGTIQLVDLGAEVGHSDAIVPAALLIRSWFDGQAAL